MTRPTAHAHKTSRSGFILTALLLLSHSLGLQSAACLPLFYSNGNVSGVTCVQFGVDDIFRDIVNFRLGQLSYGFVIDSRGRVILHRLLPQPTYWLDQPTLLELTQVEIGLSAYASDIKNLILRYHPFIHSGYFYSAS